MGRLSPASARISQPGRIGARVFVQIHPVRVPCKIPNRETCEDGMVGTSTVVVKPELLVKEQPLVPDVTDPVRLGNTGDYHSLRFQDRRHAQRVIAPGGLVNGALPVGGLLMRSCPLLYAVTLLGRTAFHGAEPLRRPETLLVVVFRDCHPRGKLTSPEPPTQADWGIRSATRKARSGRLPPFFQRADRPIPAANHAIILHPTSLPR